MKSAERTKYSLLALLIYISRLILVRYLLTLTADVGRATRLLLIDNLLVLSTIVWTEQ